jgi:protein TonB
MLNNTSNLYGSEWLALVFNNRNKNYGAYVLRAQSSSILLRSLAIVAPLFIMLFVGPMIYAQLHKEVAAPIEREVPVTLSDPIHEMKKEEAKKEEAKKEEPTPVKQQQVATTNFTANIKLVEQPVVEPPTAVELQSTVIASATQAGTGSNVNAQPEPTTGGGGGTAETGVSTTEVFDVGGVEVYPEFPGGMDAWAKFIQRNLRYPYAAQEAGVQGKVYVSFVVERDGSISDVKVARGIGFGCDDEAIRVIKKSPKWKAGQQNKQNVRVRYNMPINYLLSQ